MIHRDLSPLRRGDATDGAVCHLYFLDGVAALATLPRTEDHSANQLAQQDVHGETNPGNPLQEMADFERKSAISCKPSGPKRYRNYVLGAICTCSVAVIGVKTPEYVRRIWL